MPLRLQYPDKYRLWSDLIQGNTDRVFVPSEEPQRIGSRTPVELALTGLPVHIVIVGTVIGVRRRSEKFAAGAFVRFPDDEIEKCRRFLGLAQSPERYEHGRKARRIDCSLKLIFRTPAMADHCTVKNISETGILATCPGELYVGQYVEFDLHLDEGAPLTLRAEVSREGNGKRAAGLRFLDLSADHQRAIHACIDRIVATQPKVPSKPPVLVADDDALILEFLTKALTKYGYEVHKARRGEEALSLIRELKPALVILDILMPGIDGVDICKMMRADIEMAEIPVIFLSALEGDRLHGIADESGATDYLAKPVALADLINMVGQYLRT